MPSFVLIATANCKPGQEAEFNDWYDNVHVPEVCAIPGIKSGRRLIGTPNMSSQSPSQYITIYEIEADHPDTIIQEYHRRYVEGEIRISDTLERQGSDLYFYRPV